MSDVVDSRRKRSRERLDQLIEAITGIDPFPDETLSIYVTGSYGRLEASEESDLDLFFLLESDEPQRKLPRLQWTELAAALIQTVREQGFPEFSRDGEFLRVHNVAKMQQELGSRTEDFENTFTARMLLLLESLPVRDSSVYDRLLSRVVEFYFEDYAGHEADFRPTFLLNDILRFWRTLCLNYEHGRLERRRKGQDDDEATAKAALDNLKLGFSRVSTCYSMIASLAAHPGPLSPDRVLALARLRPLERWQDLGGSRELLDRFFNDYAWFLEQTASREEATAWLSSPEGRREARERASDFGTTIYEIVRNSATDERLRFLII